MGHEIHMGHDMHVLMYGALLLAAGAASAFAGGLFGIGGGVLRIPIFLYLFPLFGATPEVTMHMAAGTSLALGIPTGFQSALRQHKSGNLDTHFLRTWIPSLVVGVLIGIVAARFLSGQTLTLIFAITMLLAAIEMTALPASLTLAKSVPGHPIRDLIAGLIGTTSTMIGISGGTFITPTLTILNYPIHRAIAIAAASAAAISAVGAAGSIFNGLHVSGRSSFSLGYVDYLAVGVMLPAILVTAPLGVKLGNRLSDKWLRRIFGIFLMAVAADMILRIIVHT
jgi:uncharacterized membrane protein YfcA